MIFDCPCQLFHVREHASCTAGHAICIVPSQQHEPALQQGAATGRAHCALRGPCALHCGSVATTITGSGASNMATTGRLTLPFMFHASCRHNLVAVFNFMYLVARRSCPCVRRSVVLEQNKPKQQQN